MLGRGGHLLDRRGLAGPALRLSSKNPTQGRFQVPHACSKNFNNRLIAPRMFPC
jgi:hypothetical protein